MHTSKFKTNLNDLKLTNHFVFQHNYNIIFKMAAKGMEYFWNLSSILLLGKFFFIKNFLLKKKKSLLNIIRISIFLLKCHLPLSKSCEYVKLLYIFFWKYTICWKTLKKKTCVVWGKMCMFSYISGGIFWNSAKYICHIDRCLLAWHIFKVTVSSIKFCNW